MLNYVLLRDPDQNNAYVSFTENSKYRIVKQSPKIKC